LPGQRRVLACAPGGALARSRKEDTVTRPCGRGETVARPAPGPGTCPQRGKCWALSGLRGLARSLAGCSGVVRCSASAESRCPSQEGRPPGPFKHFPRKTRTSKGSSGRAHFSIISATRSGRIFGSEWRPAGAGKKERIRSDLGGPRDRLGMSLRDPGGVRSCSAQTSRSRPPRLRRAPLPAFQLFYALAMPLTQYNAEEPAVCAERSGRVTGPHISYERCSAGPSSRR